MRLAVIAAVVLVLTACVETQEPDLSGPDPLPTTQSQGSTSTIDSGMDTDTTSSVCVPESDSAFCARLDIDCEMLSDVDNCGDPRDVDCGTCGSSVCLEGVCTPIDDCIDAVAAAADVGKCMNYEVSLTACMNGCGVFYNDDCVAANCRDEATAYYDCLAHEGGLAVCDSLCVAMCTTLIDECGVVISMADCEAICEADDLPIAAACGAVHDCGNAVCAYVDESTCETDEFRCLGVDQCIPDAEVCDGNADCLAQSDEACAFTCAADERLCDGACVACPTAGVENTACNATNSCAAGTCLPDYVPCSTGCCPVTINRLIDGMLGDVAVLEDGNSLHLLWHDSEYTVDSIWHQELEAGVWSVATQVVSRYDAGDDLAATLTDPGTPKALWWEWSNNDSRYHIWSTSFAQPFWQFDSVDQGYHWRTDLAVVADGGDLHILHGEELSTWHADGTFTDADPWPGALAVTDSLTLDPNGSRHVLDTDGVVWTWDGAWSSTTQAPPWYYGSGVGHDMVIDSAGRVHVLLFDFYDTHHTLYHAVLDGNVWTVDLIRDLPGSYGRGDVPDYAVMTITDDDVIYALVARGTVVELYSLRDSVWAFVEVGYTYNTNLAIGVSDEGELLACWGGYELYCAWGDVTP